MPGSSNEDSGDGGGLEVERKFVFEPVVDLKSSGPKCSGNIPDLGSAFVAEAFFCEFKLREVESKSSEQGCCAGGSAGGLRALHADSVFPLVLELVLIKGCEDWL